MKPVKLAKIIRLSGFDDEDTGPFGLPAFTMVGSPIAERPLAPLGNAISSYLERYPPKLDDAVVLDLELDGTMELAHLWRAK